MRYYYLEVYNEINPFFLKLILVKASYHGNTTILTTIGSSFYLGCKVSFKGRSFIELWEMRGKAEAEFSFSTPLDTAVTPPTCEPARSGRANTPGRKEH